MAIYGIGSTWSDGKEVKSYFFDENKIMIGWDKAHSSDLYSMIASIKVGDIVYLKSNRPGSLDVTIKGICIVKDNFMNCMTPDFFNWESLSLNVIWISKETFHVSIPQDTGKLTNVRAATLYEEFHPFVQEAIINKIVQNLKGNINLCKQQS